MKDVVKESNAFSTQYLAFSDSSLRGKVIKLVCAVIDALRSRLSQQANDRMPFQIGHFIDREPFESGHLFRSDTFKIGHFYIGHLLSYCTLLGRTPFQLEHFKIGHLLSYDTFSDRTFFKIGCLLSWWHGSLQLVTKVMITQLHLS